MFETVTNVGFPQGTQLTFVLHQLHSTILHTLGRFRLSMTTDARNDFADGLSNGGDVEADWIILHPLTADATGGAILTIQGDDSILASGPSPDTSVYTVTAFSTLVGITGFRLEALEDTSLPQTGPGRAPDNGNFVLTELQVRAVPAPPLTELFSSKDSFLRDGADNTNEGANPLLRIQAAGHNRVVVGFDLSGIDTTRVAGAMLILTIVDNANNWGSQNNRTVEAHPLLVDFTEGNGQNAGVPGAVATRGQGRGLPGPAPRTVRLPIKE